MPSLLLLLLLAASLTATARAANIIKFINHCTYPIYFFEVGNGFAGEDHQAVTVPSGGFVIHQLLNTDGAQGGMSIKVRDVPEYRVAPAGILQAEYNLHSSATGTLWYDLSLVDCDKGAEATSPRFCPLIQGGVKMFVPGHEHKGCRTASCDHTGCKNAYLESGPKPGDPTLSCDAGADIHFETCVNSVGPMTILDKPNPNHGSEQGSLQISPDAACE
ncbi:hypothetical protein IAQ61_002774 [Plenodomus lingam]|uniref:uncharacterized protein n=1 Tax=Leptosphaeria maculans TaxID=5022 RepID=UPI003318C7F1|nr:hypothetical protein IAQ61_002774 [Plenodomus lingam]